MNNNTILVKAALLLAVALVSQSLRLILPLPPFILMFVIGTCLNATLLMSVYETNLKFAAVIAIVTPIVAFMQGQLFFAPFIPVVAAGNLTYILIVELIKKQKHFIIAIFAPLGKTTVLFAGLTLVFSMFALPENIVIAMTFALGWPQIITGACGTMIGFLLISRIGTNKFNY